MLDRIGRKSRGRTRRKGIEKTTENIRVRKGRRDGSQNGRRKEQLGYDGQAGHGESKGKKDEENGSKFRRRKAKEEERGVMRMKEREAGTTRKTRHAPAPQSGLKYPQLSILAVTPLPVSLMRSPVAGGP